MSARVGPQIKTMAVTISLFDLGFFQNHNENYESIKLILQKRGAERGHSMQVKLEASMAQNTGD